MKTLKLNFAKSFIAALIVAGFAFTVQANTPNLVAKADTSKMAKMKKDKMMKDDKMKMKKDDKMKKDKMKMKKDTMSKM